MTALAIAFAIEVTGQLRLPMKRSFRSRSGPRRQR
jgi:hypothetical protein